MLRICGLTFLLVFSIFSLVAGQGEGFPRVAEPVPGTVLQGVVRITGSTETADFQYAEVSFGYAGGENGWFLLQQSQIPVQDGVLAVWDTSTIADGNYSLRVQIFLKSGQSRESIIKGLRVRNYSSVETSTPAPQSGLQPGPTATPRPLLATSTTAPTPTRLPENPAEIRSSGLAFNSILGAAFVIIAALIFGLYLLSSRK